jgi:8-oxo-dGTP pyrophosphatase MutT (NUDIX family)
MDYRCARAKQHFIYTPKVSQLSLSFQRNADTVASLRAVESAYWDYIDNYNKVTPRRYPYFKLVQFFQQIMEQKCPSLAPRSAEILKMYSKYKKSLATDGVIMYTYPDHDHQDQAQILLVRITGSKIWSMPKGKREQGEESWDCALREFHEETGIDISDTATRDMESVTILKTNFYLLEADYTIPLRRYRTNEIASVKWCPVDHILKHKEDYSKQAQLVAEFLVKRFT